MKTLIVLSDTHGKWGNIERIAPLFDENDFVVHLGDGGADMRGYSARLGEKLYRVTGNCDFSFGQEECILEAEGVRFLCCHGHRYGVKRDLAPLVRRAREADCAAALYGHTHLAKAETIDGVLCVNPGSLGSYADPSYAYLVVHDKKVTATIVKI